jgi:hypothetical protein
MANEPPRPVRQPARNEPPRAEASQAPARKRTRTRRAPTPARGSRARAGGRHPVLSVVLAVLLFLWSLRIPVQRAWDALLSRLQPRTRFWVRVGTWTAVLLSPLYLLNMTVAYLGHTVVFPLSPYFLREKVSALSHYGEHRSLCFFTGHPELTPLIAAAEARQRLPRGLLAAIIQVESAGRPHRISAAGAMGLGQLMPNTASDLGVSDPFDSAANVDGAARLLAQHMTRYNRRLRLVVAAYHAGPGAVRGRVPNNGQTPGYVAKVMGLYASKRHKRAALARVP